MEYVDGETLRERMSRGGLDLNEVLDISMQIASALVAAHSTSITHRDVKPDNVMLRRDGYVKVLDFGLAKLTELPAGTDTEAPTRPLVNTDPGTVMGTVGYMSPEQARGHATDARTDIWSLGVVIYQMVTNRLPFEGSSNSDVIAAILGKEPPPLARYARDVPEALEWIVTKALTKDPEERYQTAKEMMVDLRRIKQRLDAHAEIERSSSPDSTNVVSGVAQSTAGAATQSSAQAVEPSIAGSGVSTAPAVSSAEYIVSEIKRHKTGLGIIAVLVVVAIVAGGFLIYKVASSNKPTAPPAIKFTRLTNGGKVGNEPLNGGASISPDGKYVVFWTAEGDQTSCYVRQISTSSLVRIVGPVQMNQGGSVFSPDGEFVYFNGFDKNDPDGALFKVPVLGGQPQKILEGIWTPPQSIPEVGNATVVEVPADGGNEHAITSPQWSHVFRVIWIRDGTGLVFTANSSFTSTGDQVWFLSYPDGAAHRITNDLNGYGQFSVGLTADSNTIVTVQVDFTHAIWMAPPSEDASKARQISNGKYEGALSVDAAPDGRIVYLDYAGAGTEIWTMKADGSDKKQLTSDGSIKNRANFTRDGRYILFDSNRSGAFNIWRMDSDGNNQKQLTSSESFATGAVGSSDGKWIVYQALRDGKWGGWKMPSEGGEATRMMDRQCIAPAVSPDGHRHEVH